jgi:hypothetical protein
MPVFALSCAATFFADFQRVSWRSEIVMRCDYGVRLSTVVNSISNLQIFL